MSLQEIEISSKIIPNFKIKRSLLLKHIIKILIIIIIIFSFFSTGFFTSNSSAQVGYDAAVTGKVWDDTINADAVNFTVKIYGDTFLGNSSLTNKTGEYYIDVPSGDLTLEIKKNGKTYKKHEFSIESGQIKRLDFKIATEKKVENPFAWINVDTIVQNIIDNWYALILIIILCVVAPILLTVIDKAFDRIHKKKFTLLDEKALLWIENVTKYNVYIAFVILLLFILSILFPGFNDSIWKYIAPHIVAIYTIIILFIFMRLILLILRRSMDYLKGNLSKKPKLKLSPRYIGILEILLKYIIIIIFGVNIIIIALAIFGMGDVISEAFSNFFSKNSGYIFFMVTIIIIMYFAGRFIRSFTEDMKKKETAKVSPQVADMVGKVGKIGIYLFGAIIIIFALLQMAQMGELATTIITMMTLVIGIVVAMAATGSIGNILSGLVLNAFRPYKIGDRVKVNNTIGDIVDSNLVFVRIKTLNGEIVNIPNNNVIADQIFNFSQSGAFAVNVDVGIGYNVPSELVKKLLIDAARETKDIEDDPRPYVIITMMGDYAVTYKLRAFVTNAKIMFRVRSNLMANVQQAFYSHGVEILSPWYLVKRDEKMPSEKEIMDSWESTDKKSEEVFEKEVEESITGGFDLMEKALSEPDKGKPSTPSPQPSVAQPTVSATTSTTPSPTVTSPPPTTTSQPARPKPPPPAWAAKPPNGTPPKKLIPKSEQ